MSDLGFCSDLVCSGSAQAGRSVPLCLWLHMAAVAVQYSVQLHVCLLDIGLDSSKA